MSQTHYRPSEKPSVLGIVFGGLTGAVVAPLLAAIYAVAIVFIPLVYVNLLLTCGFGVAVGAAVAMALHFGKNRSTAVSITVISGAVILAYWLHWIFWFAAQYWRADFPPGDAVGLLFPPYLLEAIGSIYEEGTWSIGRGSDEAVSGFMLGIVWFAEALVILGGGIVVGLMTGAGNVFCERCDRWCHAHEPIPMAIDPTIDSVTGANNQDWQTVVLNPAMNEHSFFELVTHECESCREMLTISLSQVTISFDNKGKEQRNNNILADRVLITPSDLAHLRHLLTERGHRVPSFG